MTTLKLIFSLSLFSSLFLIDPPGLIAQDNKEEKEVIIIEKTIDQEGNVISKSTKRYNGIYNEDDIQKLLDEEPLPPVRSYDLEGLGFGDDFQEFFQQEQRRPTIGVNLNFDNGQATVEKVVKGSGAEQADIREGDLVISINNVAISAIDDIYDILDGKSKGDKVSLVVFRDGEEIEKEVELGLTGKTGLFFEFPEGGTFRLFGDGDSGLFPEGMDSLLRQFPLMDELEGFNFDRFRSMNDNEDSLEMDGERATLGAYIEDGNDEVRISELIPDSAADQAGLRANDIILRIDDNIVTSYREISAFMNTKRKGDLVVIQIDRSGTILDIEVTLD